VEELFDQFASDKNPDGDHTEQEIADGNHKQVLNLYQAIGFFSFIFDYDLSKRADFDKFNSLMLLMDPAG
jgi:hypothetical protein